MNILRHIFSFILVVVLAIVAAVIAAPRPAEARVKCPYPFKLMHDAAIAQAGGPRTDRHRGHML